MFELGLVGSSSCSVFLFLGWIFVLVRLRLTWMLNMYMSMSRTTKVETQVHSCMAIFHRKVQGSLALTGPDFDHFLNTGEEEILIMQKKSQPEISLYKFRF